MRIFDIRVGSFVWCANTIHVSTNSALKSNVGHMAFFFVWHHNVFITERNVFYLPILIWIRFGIGPLISSHRSLNSICYVCVCVCAILFLLLFLRSYQETPIIVFYCCIIEIVSFLILAAVLNLWLMPTFACTYCSTYTHSPWASISIERNKDNESRSNGMWSQEMCFLFFPDFIRPHIQPYNDVFNSFLDKQTLNDLTFVMN